MVVAYCIFLTVIPGVGISVVPVTGCIVIYHKVVVAYYIFYFIFIPGVGISVVLITGCIVIYYNVVVAYCIFYFFASMAGTLPWTNCDQDWNTCYCRDSTMDMNSTIPWENGTRLYNECSKFSIFPECFILMSAFHIVLFLRWVVIPSWDASFSAIFIFVFLLNALLGELCRLWVVLLWKCFFLRVSKQDVTEIITISENIIR